MRNARTSKEAQPIAIVGMHRSGTSMVARLLNLCGLYLGSPEELAFKDVHNPEGYWEHPRFVALNERLLLDSGADWDFPAPVASPSPEKAQAERKRGAALAAELANQPSWGWKNPRTSLTLPFWRDVLPNLKAVVCVRHPIEVAWSLRQRNAHSSTFGTNLWLEYNRRILEAIPKSQRVVTHYDAYFTEAPSELRRVLLAMGLTVEEERLTHAASTVERSHRHHRFDSDQLAAASVTPEVLKVYRALCEEAEWDDAQRTRSPAMSGKAGQAFDADRPPRSPNGWAGGGETRLDITPLELEAAHLALQAARAELMKRDEEHEATVSTVAALRAQLAASHTEVAKTGAALHRIAEERDVAAARLAATEHEQDATLVTLATQTAELGDSRQRVQALTVELNAAREEWERIRSGFGWPMLEGLWRWRARLVPHGGRLNQALQMGLRLSRSLKRR